jgi:hypothetical protein
MRPWLLIALAAAVAACTTLPDPQPLPHGEEAAHAVSEIGPGHWHVMVRVNYYAPETEAERLLRNRAAALCPGEDAVLEDLHLVSQPHQASADVHCRPLQDMRTGVGSPAASVAAESPTPLASRPVHPPAAAAPERAMVKSGPGVALSRPEPGYLPAFASIAADRPDGEERPVAAAEPAVADGWIPANGEATEPSGVAVAVEELPAPAPEEEPTKRFWPTVRDTYDGLVAEIE